MMSLHKSQMYLSMTILAEIVIVKLTTCLKFNALLLLIITNLYLEQICV